MQKDLSATGLLKDSIQESLEVSFNHEKTKPVDVVFNDKMGNFLSQIQSDKNDKAIWKQKKERQALKF